MKPFMRLDASEYCSTCHKVHLDVPVNDYRWIRGFNDYDNWQASGVSGQGARSFYYPEQPSTCVDCHMPLRAVGRSRPARDGMVHSHRFPGANTAVPFVNHDAEQLKVTDRVPEVRLHHRGHLRRLAGRRGDRRHADGAPARATAPQAMSSFAVGEEAEQTGAGGDPRSRPHGGAARSRRAGARARLHGPRRRRRAHAQDRPLLPGRHGGCLRRLARSCRAATPTGASSSGAARWRTTARGPVEPGAHFYRSYQLDGEGNPINKRNAWQTRSLLYVRLIPPGAADVAHYRVRIPDDARGPITFTAKLNYRKFSHYYTQFAYAGQPEPGQPASAGRPELRQPRVLVRPGQHPGQRVRADQGPRSPTCRSSRWPRPRRRSRSARTPRPTGRPSSTRRTASAGTTGASACCCRATSRAPSTRSRSVTEAEPEYADGWLNVARALIQEGETDAAKPFIAEGAGIATSARPHPLLQGHDREGRRRLRRPRWPRCERAAAKYPRDRVVLNQIGAHPVPEARVRRGAGRARSRGRGRSRGRADALHRDALLRAAWATTRRPRAKRSCSAASRPTSRRRRSPPSRGC